MGNKMVKRVKQQVGLFGDLIEGLAKKFLASIFGITNAQMEAFWPVLVAAIQAIIKYIGLKETTKMLAFVAKRPAKFVQVMQQTMAEGK
jgi:hypothetical protein